MNPSYTRFTLIMRGVFLLLASCALAFFLMRLRGQAGARTGEQKAVVWLSIGLIFFNDPYYFIGVFQANMLSVFCSTLFLTGFVVQLLLTWLFLQHAMLAAAQRR